MEVHAHRQGLHASKDPPPNWTRAPPQLTLPFHVLLSQAGANGLREDALLEPCNPMVLGS